MSRPADRELLLAAQTLSTTEDFATRVAASAEAGFEAIGLRPADYLRARAAGSSDAQLRGILAAAGVEVAELSVLSGFCDEPRSERSLQVEETLWRMADALGGRYLMAIAEVGDSLDRVAEHLAGLCDRAAAYGVRVGLEFLPWTSVPDAATAWEIVRRADHPNAGVVVDSWHHFRGARDPDQLLAIPPDRVVAIQIDDADAEPVGTLLDDTLHRRRLPGEGDFALVDFVRLLEDHGVAAPYSIEVLSDELHALDPHDAARRAFAATRELFAGVDARSA